MRNGVVGEIGRTKTRPPNDPQRAGFAFRAFSLNGGTAAQILPDGAVFTGRPGYDPNRFKSTRSARSYMPHQPRRSTASKLSDIRNSPTTLT